MFKKLNLFLIACLLVSVSGCARTMDIPKVIWGSSTRALEEARSDAISKTYRCSFNDCFDAVLDLARKKKEETPEITETDTLIIAMEKQGIFDVFIENRKKRHIVVMGIAGNVSTTEVGIFFSQPTLTTVKLEVTSLSSSAKRNVAEPMFEELDLRFSEPQ